MNQYDMIRKYFRTIDAHDAGCPVIVCTFPGCSARMETDTTFTEAWWHLKATHKAHGESGYYGPRPHDPVAFTVKAQ